MTFSSRFPMTAWIWRKLRAPLTRRLFCGALALAVLSGIALRLEAVLFALRTRSVLLTLRKVDAGQTSKNELLRLLPSLRQIKSADSNCGRGTEILQIERTFPSSALAERVFSAVHDNAVLYKIVYWLGYRPRRLYIEANVDHRVVTRWAFSLMVAPPENHYPGMIMVGVSSPISVMRFSASPIADEQNPYFSARRFIKWPEWSLEASFSRLAAPELKDRAVDLRLSCVWSLRGCSNATQLLPRVEEERLRLHRAALERLASGEPCPPFIVPAKVRDANEIVLLKIKSATLKQSDWTPLTPGTAVQYEIVRTLELRESRFERVRRDADWFPLRLTYGDLEGTANPSVRLIAPGAMLIAFEGRGAAASPCNLLPATADILGRVNEALALKDWSYG